MQVNLRFEGLQNCTRRHNKVLWLGFFEWRMTSLVCVYEQVEYFFPDKRVFSCERIGRRMHVNLGERIKKLGARGSKNAHGNLRRFSGLGFCEWRMSIVLLVAQGI